MGVIKSPEVLFARKIIAKYKITVPFNLENIVKDYATLLYKPIPIQGVDGVSLNIKTPGKTPMVIVNSSLPLKRQRFTLAHELGHLIIPWHLGTIVDDIYTDAYKNYSYQELEQEANRFAAEILMPNDWIISIISENSRSWALLHKFIGKQAEVSDHAAVIRLIKYLPKNLIYVAEEFGIIEHTAKSEKTNAHLQEVNAHFDEHFYSHVKSYSKFSSGITVYHWYELEGNIEIETEDNRSWREILDKITRDLKPVEGDIQFKKSINGIMAFANGVAKKENDYSLGTIISICIHRLQRKGLEGFVAHPEFDIFVKNRAMDFLK